MSSKADDLEVFAEARAVQQSIIRLSTALRANPPDSLSHIPQPTLDAALILALVFMKQRSLDLSVLEQAGNEVQVPISSIEEFLLRNAGNLSIDSADIPVFVEFLRDRVLTSPKYRTYLPFDDNGHVTSPKQYIIATVTDDSAALRPETIIDLARLRDLAVMTGTETLDFKTYQLQMVIQNRQFNSVISQLASINEQIASELHVLNTKRDLVSHHFSDIDFQAFGDDLQERHALYMRLNERMKESGSMLSRMTTEADDEERPPDVENALDEAREAIARCVASFSALAARCSAVIDELMEAAKRHARYDISDLFDFEKTVVGELGGMTMDQLSALPELLLFPVCLNMRPEQLISPALMANIEAAPKRERDEGFIDMSDIEADLRALEAMAAAKQRADAAAEALGSFIDASSGECKLSEMLSDPAWGIEFSDPGVFGRVCLEDALLGKLGSCGYEARIGDAFAFGDECIASDIEFVKGGATA